jgi:hypothetical protein
MTRVAGIGLKPLCVYDRERGKTANEFQNAPAA